MAMALAAVGGPVDQPVIHDAPLNISLEAVEIPAAHFAAETTQ